MIFNIYFPFWGKCQEKVSLWSVTYIILKLYRMVSATQIPFTKYLPHHPPLSSRGLALSPQSTFICSQRVLVKRTDAPFHPKVSSQQCCAIRTSLLQVGSPLLESSATHSWASMGQEQNNELTTWRFKGNFESLFFQVLGKHPSFS